MKVSLRMDDMVSIAGAAAALGKSKSAVYRMVKNHRIGYIWAYRRGNRWLMVDNDVIVALTTRQKAETAPEVL